MKFLHARHMGSSFDEVTSFKYDEIGSFSEGLAAYRFGNKWGFLKSDGVEIIDAEYTDVGTYTNGFVWASLGDFKDGKYYGKYGFLNIEGKRICPLIYDSVRDFNSGIAVVKLEGYYGIINSDGKEITPIQYDYIDEGLENFVFVQLGENYFVVDRHGVEYSEQKFSRDKLTGQVLLVEDDPF